MQMQHSVYILHTTNNPSDPCRIMNGNQYNKVLFHGNVSTFVQPLVARTGGRVEPLVARTSGRVQPLVRATGICVYTTGGVHVDATWTSMRQL